MELKVGDKVRFLNEKGGGVVSKLISTSLVHVAIEEGFEIPVLASELVKVEPGGVADNLFYRPVKAAPDTSRTDEIRSEVSGNTGNSGSRDTRYESSKPSDKTDANQEPVFSSSDNKITPIYKQTGSVLGETVFIAWEPVDQQWLLTGSLNIYLVNNSPFDVVYAFFMEEVDATFAGVDYDVIPPYSKAHIETITREDLELWSAGVVQMLFYSSEMKDLLQPLHARFRIKPTRFYKEQSYTDFRVIGSKAIVVKLGDLISQRISESQTAMQSADPQARQKIEALAPKALIDRHNSGHREAEVDLHISALRDDFSTMPNHEILQYQVEYFVKMLESAISHNYLKVVFIHGVGNGVLKSAIIHKIRDYENIELRNASFARYGNGAVEILIHS